MYVYECTCVVSVCRGGSMYVYECTCVVWVCLGGKEKVRMCDEVYANSPHLASLCSTINRKGGKKGCIYLCTPSSSGNYEDIYFGCDYTSCLSFYYYIFFLSSFLYFSL